jgi:hypothetical protein
VRVIGRPWWNSRLADTRKGASATPVAPEKYDALHFDVLAYVVMDFGYRSGVCTLNKIKPIIEL